MSMTFGERFKQLRLRKRLTQEKLADKFFLNKSSISRYEQDKQMPEIDLLEKFSDFFGVSVDHLLGKNDNTTDSSANNRTKSLEDYIKEAETLMLFGEVMDENDKQAILTAIQVAYETAIKKNVEQKKKDNK